MPQADHEGERVTNGPAITLTFAGCAEHRPSGGRGDGDFDPRQALFDVDVWNR
jgi:hypothetical protein